MATRNHPSELLCHLADTYREEQLQTTDTEGRTIAIVYTHCSHCHKTLEKSSYPLGGTP